MFSDRQSPEICRRISSNGKHRDVMLYPKHVGCTCRLFDEIFCCIYTVFLIRTNRIDVCSTAFVCVRFTTVFYTYRLRYLLVTTDRCKYCVLPLKIKTEIMLDKAIRQKNNDIATKKKNK